MRRMLAPGREDSGRAHRWAQSLDAEVERLRGQVGAVRVFALGAGWAGRSGSARPRRYRHDLARTRFLRALPLLIVSPLLMWPAALLVALRSRTYLFWRPARPPQAAAACPAEAGANTASAPAWSSPTGTAAICCERYLPSVVAALAGNPANEIIVVDNGSTDGSADFVRARVSRKSSCWRSTATSASAADRTPASAPRRTTSWCC